MLLEGTTKPTSPLHHLRITFIDGKVSSWQALDQDKIKEEEKVDESAKYLQGEYNIEKLDVGHWLIQESFESVSNSILKHLNAN